MYFVSSSWLISIVFILIIFFEVFFVSEDFAVWARADGAFEVKGLGIECPVDFEEDDVGLHFFFDCADFPVAEWLTGGELWPDEAAVFFEVFNEAVEGLGIGEADQHGELDLGW